MSNLKVYTYIPNLIGNHYLVYHSSVGYFRITNLLLLCITARNYPFLTALLYSLAAFGDLFDGMAARKFNQSSAFGAVLDMVTDRASNAVLLGILALLYEDYGFLFLWMLSLDLISHWYQMYATLYCNESHHKVCVNKFKLLDIYYKTPYVLFLMCLGSEAAYVCLYLVDFKEEINIHLYNLASSLLVVCTPVLIVKNIINIVQLMNAAEKINDYEQQLKQKK